MTRGNDTWQYMWQQHVAIDSRPESAAARERRRARALPQEGAAAGECAAGAGGAARHRAPCFAKIGLDREGLLVHCNLGLIVTSVAQLHAEVVAELVVLGVDLERRAVLSTMVLEPWTVRGQSG